MSVIFQTLRKLQQQETDPARTGSPKSRARKSGVLGQLLHTPLAMGIFLGGIFIAGFGLLYGLDRIVAPQREPMGSTYKASIEKRTSRPSFNPPQNQPESDIRMETPQFSAADVAVEMAPPVFNQSEDVQATPEPTPAVYCPSDSIPPKPATYAPAAAGESGVNCLVAQPGEPPNKFPASGLPVSAVEMPAPETTASGLQGSSLESSSGNGLATAGATEARTVAKIAEVVTQLPDSEQEQHLANLEKFRRAARKRAAVAQLVTRLEGAIERMDEPEVKKMLHRLSEAKGRDNLYVLNLKAFWYLKQNRYSETEALLMKILEVNPDHLQAGLNMAIVEVKTQRHGAALERLAQLRELYPENPVVTDMLRKLQ